MNLFVLSVPTSINSFIIRIFELFAIFYPENQIRNVNLNKFVRMISWT